MNTNTKNNDNKKHYNNVIKVSLDTDVKKAINYVKTLFEKNIFESVYMCALSLAISKLILITEIVKSKVKNLHQINNIDCLVTRVKTPIISGSLSKLKRIPKLEIILTKIEPNDKNLVGYQKPDVDLEINRHKLLNRRGRIIKRGAFFRVRRNPK